MYKLQGYYFLQKGQKDTYEVKKLDLIKIEENDNERVKDGKMNEYCTAIIERLRYAKDKKGVSVNTCSGVDKEGNEIQQTEQPALQKAPSIRTSLLKSFSENLKKQVHDKIAY